MNIRILSGILFLVASVVTLPLVLLFVTLIIPIFFFIIAIMMFARKNKVEIVPAYGYPGYDDNFDYRYNEPDYQQQPPIYDDYERHQPNDDMAYHMPQETSNSSFNEDDKYDQYPKRAIMVTINQQTMKMKHHKYSQDRQNIIRINIKMNLAMKELPHLMKQLSNKNRY